MAEFSNRFSVGDTVVVKTEISATTGEIVDVTDLGITVEFDTQFSGQSLNFHPWSSVIYVNKTA